MNNKEELDTYYQKSFQGLWIPVELYNNRELTWLEKILLLDIQSIDDGRGLSLFNALDFDHLCGLLNVSTEMY